MTKPTKPSEYTVTVAGWIAGAHRVVGDPVQLTAAQAKYLNVTLANSPDPAPKSGGQKSKSSAASK